MKEINLEKKLRKTGSKGFPSYVVSVPKLELLIHDFDTTKKVKVKITQ